MVDWVKDDEVALTVKWRPGYAITVKSEPPGVKVTIDGIEGKTPETWLVSPGTYTVEVPAEGFIEWEDGSTELVRTIEVVEPVEIIAYYTPKLKIPWGPIAIGAAAVVTIASVIYAVRRKKK